MTGNKGENGVHRIVVIQCTSNLIIEKLSENGTIFKNYRINENV